jgi:hypothetical protein
MLRLWIDRNDSYSSGKGIGMGKAINRSRSWREAPVAGVRRSSQFASWTPYSDLGVNCSEGYIGQQNYQRSGHWSGGGAWFLSRNITRVSPIDVSTGLIQGQLRMGSNLLGIVGLTKPPTPTDSQLDALGATAISRTEPTNPAFDMSTALGEIMHEGIPNAPGAAVMERTNLARKAGSSYLNTDFGWLPLVRSVRDFASAVENHDDIIRKYQEGANRTLKRRYHWPDETAYAYNPTGFGSVPANGNFTGGGRYESTLKKMWFEVDYVYHLPIGQSMDAKIRRFGSYARKLLGVDLSPEVLWNLAPWSWAADWVSNTGDVLHNVSALGTDGLVIRNGYIMCHIQRLTIDTGRFNGTGPTSYRYTIDETKVRRPATPYGFGLSWSGLTAKQQATILALGLSKW